MPTAPTKISAAGIRSLRKLAHHLKPVLRVGDAGVSDAFIAELEVALTHHELIKLRVAAGDKAEFKAVVDGICEKTGAIAVQNVGHTVVLYRENPDKRQFAGRLSNAR